MASVVSVVASQTGKAKWLCVVQRYRPKAFLRPGTTTTGVQYIGHSAHALRLRIESAARSSEGPTD